MLDILLSLVDCDIKIKQDPSRLRPSDVELLVGDPTKIRKAVGWKPEIKFTKTLKDLLDYWRQRV
jgi:GDP-4-dehydro-6-deoxy-D-mannose reductase